MKRLFILLSIIGLGLILSASVAFSQSHCLSHDMGKLGVTAAPSISSFNFPLENSPKAGFDVGLVHKMKFGDFGFTKTVNYSMRGFRLYVPESDEYNPVNLNYISASATFHWFFVDKVSLDPGIELSAMFRAQGKNNGVKENIHDNFDRPHDLALQLGFTYEATDQFDVYVKASKGVLKQELEDDHSTTFLGQDIGEDPDEFTSFYASVGVSWYFFDMNKVKNKLKKETK